MGRGGFGPDWALRPPSSVMVEKPRAERLATLLNSEPTTLGSDPSWVTGSWTRISEPGARRSTVNTGCEAVPVRVQVLVGEAGNTTHVVLARSADRWVGMGSSITTAVAK